jgi:hypothetical protein
MNRIKVSLLSTLTFAVHTNDNMHQETQVINI